MSETPTFDPFELVKAVQNNDPEPIEGIDILNNRQAFKDQEIENPYANPQGEDLVAEISEEDRRGYVLTNVSQTLYTDDPEVLMTALTSVEAWLRDGKAPAPPEAGEAGSGEPSDPSPDDHPGEA